MGDLCAFCSTQLNSLHIFSLYCSEQCLKADARKCCSFHGCLHPDDSAKHDHLRYCHHHRNPTSPSLALTSSSTSSLNNFSQHDICQEKDEWMDFLQSQYNASHQHDTHRRLSDSVFSNASVPGRQEDLSSRGRHSLSTLRQFPTMPRKMSLACHHVETTPHNCPVRSIREKLAAQQSTAKIVPVDLKSVQVHEQLTIAPKVQETCVEGSTDPSSPTPSTTTSTTTIDTTPLPLHLSPLLLLPSISSKAHDTPFSSLSQEMDQTWPEMDKYFFCFHDDLCRSLSSSESSSESDSEDSVTGRSRSRSSSLSSSSSSSSSSSLFSRRFISELPPPSLFTSLNSRRSTLSSEDGFDDTHDFLPLSASIWGPGWQQVEPLPASFVQALQRQQQLDKAAAEKEAQAAAAAAAAQSQGQPSKSKKKKAKKAAAAAAAAALAKANGSDSESVDGSEEDSVSSGGSDGVPKTCNSLCSARLPRSLQFVDEQPE
ncbi:hypothetical protein BG005_004610 [Podila minutissima]|nr:hypothetical protein BG005_004610 [Podila minutissima]